MTIEQKAKAYDRAIEKIKYVMEHGVSPVLSKEGFLFLFPELKESEDERIRKSLINFFDNANKCGENPMYEYGIYPEEILAWLEKQGEKSIDVLDDEEREFADNVDSYRKDLDEAYQKGYDDGSRVEREKQGEQKPYGQRKKCFDCQFNYADECKGSCQMKRDEQKPTDKAEPKFHEGEWIIHQGTENIYQVVAVIDNQYQLKYGDNYTIQYCEDVDRCARLWTIQDAKDGDVLCYETKDEIRIFIYKNGHIHYHCCYCNAHLTTVDSFFVVEKYLLCYVHPATKEQRDLLFVKMQEAGYEWNDDKKELKKIVRLTLEHYMNN